MLYHTVMQFIHEINKCAEIIIYWLLSDFFFLFLLSFYWMLSACPVGNLKYAYACSFLRQYN